jgi:futalosine hydrolase
MMSGATEAEIGRRRVVRGEVAGVPVALVEGGMGKTNGAQSLTALLEREREREIRGVIGFGVGGAYPGGGATLGDVALATAEIYGDEGVISPEGWLSTEGIGIPLLNHGSIKHFNEFPLDARRVARARAALRERGVAPITGPFVTVSCCSGVSAKGAELGSRFGAVCETMESAAHAHVTALYGLPYLGVRGISNLVEDRDTSRWRLREAADVAAAAVAAIVADWED